MSCANVAPTMCWKSGTNGSNIRDLRITVVSPDGDSTEAKYDWPDDTNQ